MKNKLLLVTLVVSFVGIVWGAVPNKNSDFKVQSNVEKISITNSFSYASLNGLSSLNLGSLTANLTDPCDTPPPLPPDGTPVDPPCVDLGDENQDPNPPIFGQTQKDVRNFTATGNYVAKYYQEVPGTGFVYYDERSVVVNREGSGGEGDNLGEDGKGFELQLPNPYQVDGTYAQYRVDIVEVGVSGPPMAKAYIDIYYPVFEMPPPF